jgi:hypothetical protein
MTNMKDKVPMEAIIISPPVPYSERRKACSCDCYQAELLVKLCPLLETIKTDDPAAKALIEEALKYKNCRIYPEGCGSPF